MQLFLTILFFLVFIFFWRRYFPHCIFLLLLSDYGWSTSSPNHEKKGKKNQSVGKTYEQTPLLEISRMMTTAVVNTQKKKKKRINTKEKEQKSNQYVICAGYRETRAIREGVPSASINVSHLNSLLLFRRCCSVYACICVVQYSFLYFPYLSI